MNDSTIILLDIDDCILPSRQTHAGLVNDHESIFLININRLRMICEKWNIKIGILSSWASNLYLDESRDIICKSSNRNEREQWDWLYKELKSYIFNFRCGFTKEYYIKSFIQNPDWKKVIVFDDTDFSSCVNHNNGS
jgi:hypothetical protein